MAIMEKLEFHVRQTNSDGSVGGSSTIVKEFFNLNKTVGDLFDWIETKFHLEKSSYVCYWCKNQTDLNSFHLGESLTDKPLTTKLSTIGFHSGTSGIYNDLVVNPIIVLHPSEEMDQDGKHSEIFVIEKKDCSTQPTTSSASDDCSSTVDGRMNPAYAAGDSVWPVIPLGPCVPEPDGLASSSVVIRGSSGFIGLVNQAMTCYLNSLIQTLFMTPEFRNAVYNWESSGTKDEESLSIPYQLQKLFLLLQTSDKTALETKDLTKSFGWDSSHAWDQHDVQELCRVMFDALEVRWRKTSQSTVINKLYQGTLKDYVKCLECQIENARDDVFLDLPLAIKPFGSQQAYSSVIEALKGFVQFENLEGSNQYSCSTCNKKCNAHKGLKITKFPYLLTIQLKRFDFDYTTLHRIKLNDRMTFPDILNLNPFIDGKPGGGFSAATSGTDDDGASPIQPSVQNQDLSPPIIRQDQMHMGDDEPRPVIRTDSDDEGICLDSNGALNGSSNTASPAESEMNECDTSLINETIDAALIESYLAEGPYVYELFSIMVHSGSANGGHYYAYIKNMDTRIWYCFNDQVVTRASVEDIRKTYGGANSSLLYSYSSSTNAYMLMYRQIDPERNAKFICSNQLPPHLLNLLQRLSLEEADQRRHEEYQRSLTNFKVYCYHPDTNKLIDVDLEVPKKTTMDELLEKAYKKFALADCKISLDRCRFVKFTKSTELLETSLDPYVDGKKTVTQALPWSFTDLMIEIRPEHVPFRTYVAGGITLKIHNVIIDGDDGKVQDYFLFFMPAQSTVSQLRALLAQHMQCDEKSLTIVTDRYGSTFRLLDVLDKKLDDEVGYCRMAKMFVTSCLNVNLDAATTDATASVVGEYSDEQQAMSFTDKSATSTLGKMHAQQSSIDEKMLYFEKTAFFKVLDRYKNMISLFVYLPTNTECLDDFNTDNCDDEELSSDIMNATTSTMSVPSPNRLDIPPAPPPPPPSSSMSKSYLPSSPVSLRADEFSVASSASSTTEKHSDSTQYVTPASSRSPTPEEPSFSMAATPSPQVSPDSSPQALNACTSDDQLPELLGWDTDEYSKIDVDSIETDQSERPTTTCAAANCVVDVEGESVTSEDFTDIYFDAKPIPDRSTKEDECAYLVNCDGRMTVDAFKMKLAPLIGTRPEQFKVYKVYGNSEYPWNSMNDPIKDATGTLRIKLGRPLRDGESVVKVLLFDIKEFQPNNYLFDIISTKRTKVYKAKLIAKELLKRKRGLDVEIERLRFRDMLHGRVDFLRDEQCFSDRLSWGNADIYLQILDEPDEATSDSMVMFVRRWFPSSTTLGRLDEICLRKKCSFTEFREKLSNLSHVPADHIEVTRASDTGTFPFECPKLKLLEETTFYNCMEDDGPICQSPLNLRDDGCLIYYRDARETSKTLTEEERKEMQIKDNVRFRRTSYTWRKERALKIYTEISSSLQNDDMT